MAVVLMFKACAMKVEVDFVCSLMQAKVEVGKLIAKAQINDLEPEAGCTMMETFERQVNMALNKARDDAGKAAQISLQETNNVVRMVQAGSKGSFINISQVTQPANAHVSCLLLQVFQRQKIVRIVQKIPLGTLF